VKSVTFIYVSRHAVGSGMNYIPFYVLMPYNQS